EQLGEQPGGHKPLLAVVPAGFLEDLSQQGAGSRDDFGFSAQGKERPKAAGLCAVTGWEGGCAGNRAKRVSRTGEAYLAPGEAAAEEIGYGGVKRGAVVEYAACQPERLTRLRHGTRSRNLGGRRCKRLAACHRRTFPRRSS